jgi:monoamine oxidase
MVDFARQWLASLFGENIKAAVKRGQATRWNEAPFVRGGYSAAAPGESDARRILMEPIEGKIWFAGEAVHETLWGTVEGAWESGTRAAEAALRHIGALKEPEAEKPARRPRARRRRGGDE